LHNERNEFIKGAVAGIGGYVIGKAVGISIAYIRDALHQNRLVSSEELWSRLVSGFWNGNTAIDILFAGVFSGILNLRNFTVQQMEQERLLEYSRMLNSGGGTNILYGTYSVAERYRSIGFWTSALSSVLNTLSNLVYDTFGGRSNLNEIDAYIEIFSDFAIAFPVALLSGYSNKYISQQGELGLFMWFALNGLGSAVPTSTGVVLDEIVQ
jgi:hypothetical protein